MSGVAHTDMVSVTVHGPAGALDLAVPEIAAAADVAREYAVQSGWFRSVGSAPLTVLTSTGRVLRAEDTMLEAGVSAGAVLVAAAGTLGHGFDLAPPRHTRVGRGLSDAAAWLVSGIAAVSATVAGILVADRSDSAHLATVVLLGLTAVLCVLPLGRHTTQRAAVAPVLAGAATFAMVHEPGAVHLPVTIGVAALVASVAAATARALAAGERELANVWMTAALSWFAASAVVTLAGAEPQVYWGVLLIGALLACRLVPTLAVDVPDRMLIDLDRLAVTAWSARERRRGKRGRTVVGAGAVGDLLARGAVVVNAAGIAVAVTVGVSVPGLLGTATLGVDRVGAAALVLCVAGGLLLAARSLRHVVARTALRVAGVYALVVLLVDRADALSGALLAWLLVVLLVIALLVVVAAVATGRGWRSVRWARRAEVAETLCVAFAIGAVMVSSGLFRMLWEIRT